MFVYKKGVKMTKQAEMAIKIMQYGIPDEVQDVIADVFGKYAKTDRAEEIAGKISDILDEPGDISDIIKNIKKLKGN